MSLDLDAYFARIRLSEAPAADAEGLATIQRAQRLAIPFENLDIRLGRGIRIDSDSVFAKLVTARRGGYCFEQNRLFADALAATGFSARPLLARVLLGATGTPGLTHMLLLVTIDGQDWIADAGFGGGYTPPMPLVAGAEATAPDGALFRLIENDRGWLLTREGASGATDGRGAGSGPVDQYMFRLIEVAQADLDISNHWTATAPGTRFVDMAIVSIALPTGYAAMNDRKCGWHADGEDVMTQIDDPRDYQLRLATLFGIDLSADDVAQLGLF